MKSLLLSLAPLVMALSAQAHEFTAGDLSIGHPFAYETAPMALAAGGYLSVANAGTQADRLLAVEAPPYRAEIHESLEVNGLHQMRPVEAVEIPAGGRAELAPGGYHIMFLDLDGARLAEGDRLPAVLVFERAGRVEVVFNVEKRRSGGAGHGETGGGAGGHSGH